MSSRLLNGGPATFHEDPMRVYTYSEDPRIASIPVSAIILYIYCPRRCYIQYKLCVNGYQTMSQFKGMVAHRVLCRLFVEEPRIATLAKPGTFYQRYIDIGLKMAYEELQAILGCKASSHSWGWLVRYVNRIIYGRAIFLSSSRIRLSISPC